MIWCKPERTKDWVRLLRVISLMMKSQGSSATGYSPHELFMGRPAWFLDAPYPEDSYSTVGKWVKEQQDKVDKANAMHQRVRPRQWTQKNRHRVPAAYRKGDWVLVHHSRLPAWPRSTSDNPYFGPYKILTVDGHRITVRCSPRLRQTSGHPWRRLGTERRGDRRSGRTGRCQPHGSRRRPTRHERRGYGQARPLHCDVYRQGWRFLTLWEGFGVEEAIWEPFSAIVLPEGCLNSVLVDYLSQKNLGKLLRLAATLASQKKPRDCTLPIAAYVCVSVLYLRAHRNIFVQARKVEN